MNAQVHPFRRPARGAVFTLVSGKGGVGKTTLAANLAIALSRLGHAVTVVDGDLGLANLDVLFGLLPQRTLEHFFREKVPLEEIAIEGPAGIQLIPAGSGLPEMTRPGRDAAAQLFEGLHRLARQGRTILVDAPAGIGEGAIMTAELADRALLVTWPDPSALVDAYATLKVMHGRRPEGQVGLVVNGAADSADASAVHGRLVAASRRFLDRELALDGFIPRDPSVEESARHQQALLLARPYAPASRALERLAMTLSARTGAGPREGRETPWPRPTRTNEHKR